MSRQLSWSKKPQRSYVLSTGPVGVNAWTYGCNPYAVGAANIYTLKKICKLDKIFDGYSRITSTSQSPLDWGSSLNSLPSEFPSIIQSELG